MNRCWTRGNNQHIKQGTAYKGRPTGDKNAKVAPVSESQSRRWVQEAVCSVQNTIQGASFSHLE